MSKTAEIKTKQKIKDYREIYHRLANKGYGIAVKEYENSVRIYMPNISIREIEINTEKYGYEIRITFFACKEDYLLFIDILEIIVQMTNGLLSYEQHKISNIKNFFSDDFIIKNISSDIDLMLLLLREGKEVGLFCPFREFFMGANIFDKFKDYSNNSNHFAEELWNMNQCRLVKKFS